MILPEAWLNPKRSVLIAIGIVLGLLAIYGPGLIRWAELSYQNAQLRSEIAQLKEQNLKLYQEAKRLREDPAYAEAVARKKLGFVRPGETVIKLKSQRQTSER